MPVPQRTLKGLVPYSVEQQLYDLINAVNKLEHLQAPPTTIAARSPQTTTQQTLTVNGGLTGDGSPTDPLTVNVDGTSVIINVDGELEAPAAAGGITELTGPVTAGPGSGSQPTTITPTGVTPNTYGDATNVPQFTVNDAGQLTFAANVPISASAAGRLIGIQRFTVSGSPYTYSPTPGTSFIVLELLGPGGGSSGISSPGAGKVSIGRAGAAGAWLRKLLTANFSGGTLTIGAKGTGGASGDNAGTNGGNTTFVDTAGSPTTYTAGGGTGGNNGGSGLTTFPNLSNQVLGGSATNGDDNVAGIASELGIVQSATLARGGGGGWSRYGMGGAGSGVFSNNTSVAGGPGQGFGSGGGAPCATGTGAAQAGADGAHGYAIIWEYS